MRTHLLLSLLALCLALPLAANLTAQSKKDLPRLDQDGNPLPTDALLRIGTTRPRPTGTPQALAFTPDGARLVTIDQATAIHVWEVASGKELLALGRVANVGGCFALAADGSLAALVEAADVCRLYDVKAGQAFRTIKADWTKSRILRFSSDKKLLAAADEDMIVRVWDVASGALLRRWELNKIEVYAPDPQLAVAPDGKLLAFGSRAGCIYLCNIASGQTVEVGDKPGGYRALAFSPDGTVLAVVEPGFKQCTLWDVATRQPLRALPEDDGPYWTVAFTPDGKDLATSSWSRRVCIWNLATGKQQGGLPGERGQVTSLAFSADCKLVATGSGGCTVRIWDFAAGTQLRVFAGPHAPLVRARFTPDNKAIISYSNPWYDGVAATVRFLDPATGLILRQLDLDPDGNAVWSLAPDGNLLAVAKNGGQLNLCNLASGKDGPVLNHSNRFVLAVDISSDGRFLAAVTQERSPPPNPLAINENRQSFHVWNVADGNMVVSGMGQENQRLGCQFTADSRYLAVQALPYPGVQGGAAAIQLQPTHSVSLWDVRTGQKALRAGSPPAEGAVGTFSPSGRWFTELNKAGQTIAVRELATGKSIKRHASAAQSDCRAFSPDGRIMALGTVEGTIQLWDMVSATQQTILAGHRGPVVSLSFAPDGKRLLSCGEDTTIFVWDTARWTDSAAKAHLPLAPADAMKLWEIMANEDAEAAYTAVFRLVQSPRESVALLRQQLRPDQADETKQIGKWIEALDSNRFAEREQAMAKLGKLGNLALPALEMTLAANAPLEVRQRVQLLLTKIEREPLPASWVRTLRALEVLELLSTPDAAALLESLTRGEANSWLALEAAASLERVRKRPALR